MPVKESSTERRPGGPLRRQNPLPLAVQPRRLAVRNRAILCPPAQDRSLGKIAYSPAVGARFEVYVMLQRRSVRTI